MATPDMSREKSIIFLIRRVAAQKWGGGNTYRLAEVFANLEVSKIDNNYKLSTLLNGIIFEKLVPMEEFKFYSTKKSDALKINPKDLNQATALEIIGDLEKYYKLSFEHEKDNGKRKIKINPNIYVILFLVMFTLFNNYGVNELLSKLILLLGLIPSIQIFSNSKKNTFLMFVITIPLLLTFKIQESSAILNCLTLIIILYFSAIKKISFSVYTIYLISITSIPIGTILVFAHYYSIYRFKLEMTFLILLLLTAYMLSNPKTIIANFYIFSFFYFTLIILKIFLSGIENFNLSNLLLSIFFEILLFVTQRKSYPQFILSAIVIL
jgi:hypothetical protein